MNTSVKALIAVTGLALLSGCVAVPVGGGYYEPAPVVYAPAPVIYGPSVRFGIYGGYGRGGHGHGYRDRGRGHRHR